MMYRKFKTRTLYVLMFILSIFVVFSIIYYSKLLALKIMEYNNSKVKKSKIPQVVGHYVGKGKLDLPDEIIHANNYNPQLGWGENGKPVVIASKDLFKMQQLFQINQFNLMASDGMSLNRSLPDVRTDACKHLHYDPSHLPTASIVIVFYNEAWSVLMRTVWSIINRSPPGLVKEILLVDDGSDRKYLLSDLDTYVASLPLRTRVLRLGKRKGLVAARLLGAKEAKGEVLIFLDAHCECSEGWLEPLLTRVKENKRKVVCPVIDIISDDNFSYIKSAEFHWGAFNWHLHFRWYTIGESEMNKRKLNASTPYRTPAMAGGLFAINRDYFYEVGSYDEEMKIWGGDNLEMSIRIWTCGGEIEIAPCSHVGHLFRKSSPYTFPGGISDILDKNLIRVASVWMDEWAEMFYKFNKNAAILRDTVDVDERVSLRRKMRCHSFEWYLQNIWLENFFPMHDRFFGRIRIFDPKSVQFHNYQTVMRELVHKKTFSTLAPSGKHDAIINFLNRNTDRIQMGLGQRPSFCFTRPKANNSLKQPFGEMSLTICSYGSDNIKEMFILTTDGRIMSDDNTCLQGPEIKEDGRMKLFMKKAKKKVRMTQCSSSKLQRWIYNIDSMHIKQNGTEFCLELDEIATKWFGHETDLQHDVNLFVYLRICDTSNPLQKWIFQPIQWQ